jgi:hypothetical protein
MLIVTMHCSSCLCNISTSLSAKKLTRTWSYQCTLSSVKCLVQLLSFIWNLSHARLQLFTAAANAALASVLRCCNDDPSVPAANERRTSSTVNRSCLSSRIVSGASLIACISCVRLLTLCSASPTTPAIVAKAVIGPPM